MQERLENFEDCAFQHETFGDQFDVYYSWKYPASSSSSSRSSCDVSSNSPDCRRLDLRHRRRRWYLGVAKNGTLRTFISGSGRGIDQPIPKHRTMFVQRWTNRLSGSFNRAPIVLPLPSRPRSAAGSVRPMIATDDDDVTSSPSRQTARSTCSRLLRQCRRQNSRHRTGSRRRSHEQQRQMENADRLKSPHRSVGRSAGRRAGRLRTDDDPVKK